MNCLSSLKFIKRYSSHQHQIPPRKGETISLKIPNPFCKNLFSSKLEAMFIKENKFKKIKHYVFIDLTKLNFLIKGWMTSFKSRQVFFNQKTFLLMIWLIYNEFYRYWTQFLRRINLDLFWWFFLVFNVLISTKKQKSKIIKNLT